MLTKPSFYSSRFAAILLTLGTGIAMAGCTANGEEASLEEIGSDRDIRSKAQSGCSAGLAQGKSDANLDQVSLCVQSAAKTQSFTVEVARSAAEQSRGLMFRSELADDRGMLFPYSAPQILSFWMKNTVIPLDIIFIRADGSIESIAANTTPYSLDPVSSGENVTAVLEIRGGLSAELGMKPGDKVNWEK